MKVLKLNTSEFYPTMCEWWGQHGFPEVPITMLPKEVFVCYNSDGEPIYCVNVYYTDSLLCWLGWQISNKKVKNRDGGLDFLIKEVTNYLSILGFKHIFTTSKTKPVEDSLEKSGYAIGDTGVNHYVKNL